MANRDEFIPSNKEDIRHQNAQCTNESAIDKKWYQEWPYLMAGIGLGFLFIKSEVVSWFRIYEMFQLGSFHMYGIIGLGVLVGLISIQLIQRFKIKTLDKEGISIPAKSLDKGQLIGGIIFGLGWALTGACPGPIFALIGYGYYAYGVVFLFALVGTWVYGKYRNKLPH
jgi:uncharacterized membrane protein YedE/YeeE